jgi:hypothetical protein
LTSVSKKNKPIQSINQKKKREKMKKSVKVLLVAVFAFGTTFLAQAQDRFATISASANVVDELKVTAVDDLEFGVVMQGVNKMVNLTGGVSDNDASGTGTTSSNAQTGLFEVYAGAGSSVTLSFTFPALLNSVVGSNSMPIAFNQDATGGVAENLGYGPSNTSITKLNLTPNSITIPINDLNGSGSNGINVYVGGVVKPSASQANGSYTGDIKLTAVYN